MSLGELARAVVDAYDDRAPTGHLSTAQERVEAERAGRGWRWGASRDGEWPQVRRFQRGGGALR
jgi:hypothetical protein